MNPNDLAQLRSGLVEWASAYHPQMGLILKTVYDLYPKSISAWDIAMAVKMPVDRDEYAAFGNRIDYLRSRQLLMDVGPMDENLRPLMQAPDIIFPVDYSRPR